MITYQQEFFVNCVDEIKNLAEEHKKEKPSFNLDYDTYIKVEQAGVLRFFTARDSGKLVGLFAFIVFFHPQYQHQLWAKAESIVVSKKYRFGKVVKNLMLFSEQCLKEDGIDFMAVCVKPKTPVLRLLTSMDYEEVEVTYRKTL